MAPDGIELATPRPLCSRHRMGHCPRSPISQLRSNSGCMHAGWNAPHAAEQQGSTAAADPPQPENSPDVQASWVERGRQFSDAHLQACLHAGIQITGVAGIIIARICGHEVSSHQRLCAERHAAATITSVLVSGGASPACFAEGSSQRAVSCNSGTSSHEAPGQWSFSIGTCSGLDLADQLWMSRYLLQRMAELFNVVASLDPMPVRGIL